MRKALPSPRRFGPAALAVVVASLGAPARAQPPSFGAPNQPPVPPILNLNRLGAPPGVNYYNIVQPQVQFQSAISQLQQQTTQLQYATSAVGPGANLATGHPVFYGNYSHYYAPRGLAGVGGYGGGGYGAVGPAAGGALPLGAGAGLGGQRAGQGFGGTVGTSAGGAAVR